MRIRISDNNEVEIFRDKDKVEELKRANKKKVKDREVD